MAEETFKVDTEKNTEDKTVKVEQDFDSSEEDDLLEDDDLFDIILFYIFKKRI